MEESKIVSHFWTIFLSLLFDQMLFNSSWLELLRKIKVQNMDINKNAQLMASIFKDTFNVYKYGTQMQWCRPT